MQTAAMSTSAPLGFWDKTLSLAAWAIGVGLFASVGWMVLEPGDPRGAISLLTADHAVVALVETLALAAVVSALAAVLIGRKLPDAGVLAVALGMAVMTWRGGTTSYLLIHVTGSDADARSAMAWKLAFEGVVWFLPIVTAMVVGGLVRRWLGGPGSGGGGHSYPDMALSQIPGLHGLAGPAAAVDLRAEALAGLKATLATLVAAAVLFRLSATGSPVRSVQHGQTYFALAIALYVGGRVAFHYFPVRTVLWGCLAVPLLCLAGYVVCAASSPPAGYSQVASVPPGSFYRALPIEYISVGTSAVVLAFWHSHRSAAAHM